MAASKPTFQLSMPSNTICSLTLSCYLGTLTLVWFVFLMDIKLTPMPSLPSFYNGHTFGVWQHAENFRFLNTQSVLYRMPRLSWGLPASSFERNQLLPV